MAESLAISALKRKRATISGELLKAERRCAAMRGHLSALDTTLRLMGYEGDPADIRPVHRVRRLFPRRGELQKAVLDILRTADVPLSDMDIADRVMATKGMDPGNIDLRGTVRDEPPRCGNGYRQKYPLTTDCTGPGKTGKR